ncbi:hypothetical protein GGE16_005386 [Rhizobium leguminosarum]|uniref:Uncharacterized protein n=1 Tax=Rhizobium leguminosarum TaxID=384 RepID=A0AAE2MQW5_RHILE|nr:MULTISPECIES: hypothetical protein [Rhizobium]MBB4293299.1 hypothetical protein [Rhizobium leguminosarum]MBB4296092.1 hypothetical protein [Rhizobium leguminosarum]MBB4311439.1 hypothetical protein [Rhizobium leguminosarum]MBB4420321.1 hypothetical protein [Rhizobium leguminosarum]MBB4532455.1 hypothetical protein [Rhizobium leguminosarum]
MSRLLILLTGLIVLALLPSTSSAQDVPPDCMVSFNVQSEKVSTDISWLFATGSTASLSCGAAELLRERLFVEGDKIVKGSDLVGNPATAQQRAVTALNDLQNQVQQLPGDDVPGTLFSAGGYLVAKYLLVSCLLTVETAGGTCWAAAGKFVAATYGFFQKVYVNQSNTLTKQELLSKIENIRPALNSAGSGQADEAGARIRWVETQTNLCRSIQKDCL